MKSSLTANADDDQANATTATTRRAIRSAGKASASTNAAMGARRNRTSMIAGAPVTRNNPITTMLAAWSSPMVAGSDPDRKLARAIDAHATASTTQMTTVAVRRFIRVSPIQSTGST